MIDKPIYRRLLAAVGQAHGPIAASLLLNELADVFEEFGNEVEQLFKYDSENDDVSKGYYFAESWLRSWAEEIDNV